MEIYKWKQYFKKKNKTIYNVLFVGEKKNSFNNNRDLKYSLKEAGFKCLLGFKTLLKST